MHQAEPISPNDEWIHDKSGRKYRLNIREERTLWVLKIYDGSLLSATAQCLAQPQHLVLQDLLVLDDKPFLPLQPSGFTRMFARRQNGRPNYRGRGLGTALMTHIIQRAKERRFRRIIAYLLPDNGTNASASQYIWAARTVAP